MNFTDKAGCNLSGPCSFKFLVHSQDRYRPVEIKVLTSKADKRYYKLHNGNILDLDTKTILDRTGLTALLDD